MLPVSLDCPFLIALSVACSQHSERKPKGQSRMDNPKKLATLDTQDKGQRLEKTEMAIKNGQSKEADI
jgi:hypothetical protein